MDREDIIRMAREAGFTEGDISLFPDLIAHFAALVAAHEREQCAKKWAAETKAVEVLRQALETVQEPVAWRWKERINSDFDSWVITSSEPPPYAIEQQPLYTSPPRKREWVGLTDEEIDYQAKKDDHAVYFALGALWAEAKLKEKNT